LQWLLLFWCRAGAMGFPFAQPARSLGRSRTVRPASSVRLYSFNSLVLCARRRRWRHLASAAPRKSMNPPSRLQRASCSCSCSFTSNLRLLQPRPVRPRAKQHGGGSQTIANKLGNQNLLSAHFASLPSRRPPRRLQGSLARPPARSIRLVPLSLSRPPESRSVRRGPLKGGPTRAGGSGQAEEPKGLDGWRAEWRGLSGQHLALSGCSGASCGQGGRTLSRCAPPSFGWAGARVAQCRRH